MNMQSKLLSLAALSVSLFISTPAQAVITGTPVQCATDLSANQNSTVDGTDSWATPTSGNFLTAFKVLKKNGTLPNTVSTPSGWSAGPKDESTAGSGFRASYFVFYKTSDGTETSLTVNGTASAGSSALQLCEFDSTDLNLSVIASSQDNAEVNDNTAQTVTSGVH